MSTTLLSYLQGINAYPIPTSTLASIAERRGLDAEQEATPDVVNSKECELARADVFHWLSFAPNVSQGGQSYNLSDEQRAAFRAEANVIYAANNEQVLGVRYGYKGRKL